MISEEMQERNECIVKWESKFEIGLPVIDNQHKKLFSLCNDLHLALNNAESGVSWEDEFKHTIKECVEYVKVHFKSEEMLMQAAGFKGLKEHKEIHSLFIQKVLEFSSVENDSIVTAFRLVRFLHEWILSHIAHDDKLFVPSVFEYIKRRNAGGEQIFDFKSI